MKLIQRIKSASSTVPSTSASVILSMLLAHSFFHARLQAQRRVGNELHIGLHNGPQRRFISRVSRDFGLGFLIFRTRFCAQDSTNPLADRPANKAGKRKPSAGATAQSSALTFRNHLPMTKLTQRIRSSFLHIPLNSGLCSIVYALGRHDLACTSASPTASRQCITDRCTKRFAKCICRVATV